MINNQLNTLVTGKHFNPNKYKEIARKSVLLTKKTWDSDQDVANEMYSFLRYDIPMALIELQFLLKDMEAVSHIDGQENNIPNIIRNVQMLSDKWMELSDFITSKLTLFVSGE